MQRPTQGHMSRKLQNQLLDNPDLIPKPVFLLFHGDDSQCFRVGYAVLEESIKKMSYLKTLVFHLQWNEVKMTLLLEEPFSLVPTA